MVLLSMCRCPMPARGPPERDVLMFEDFGSDRQLDRLGMASEFRGPRAPGPGLPPPPPSMKRPVPSLWPRREFERRSLDLAD